MDTEQARQRLEAERERLLGLRESLEEVARDASSDLSSYDQHPGDMAPEVAERAKDQSLQENVEANLVEVEDALRRIEEGRYGICEATGEPISEERLEANPAARYTIGHQQVLEREARAESRS